MSHCVPAPGSQGVPVFLEPFSESALPLRSGQGLWALFHRELADHGEGMGDTGLATASPPLSLGEGLGGPAEESAAPVAVTVRAARIPEKVALSPGAGRPRQSGEKGVWPKADV